MKKETKIKILKFSIILIILLVIGLAIFLPLKLTGALDKIENIDNLVQIINDGGVYSYIIFFLIQFLQVVILPIPAAITTLAGTFVFGPWIASLISFFAIMLGSILAFFIGRKFGRKFVVWVIGEDDTKKWSEKLSKGKYIFFLMMLFPIFPDDLLCLIVGATTNISNKFFIITNIITRPISILLTCFLGSGEIIPFSGWGIIVWGILAIIMVILLVLCYKYQSKIEKMMLKLSNIFSKREKELLNTISENKVDIKNQEIVKSSDFVNANDDIKEDKNNKKMRD